MIPKLKRKEGEEIFNEFTNNANYDVNQHLSDEFALFFRKRLLAFLESNSQLLTTPYSFDLKLANMLYSMLEKVEWFNEDTASDLDFWRYLSLIICPEIISKRHGKGKIAYYSEAHLKLMYYPCLWWYFHLCWQGDCNSTYELVKNLNTDYILNLTQRMTGNGVCVDIQRKIMRTIASLPANVRAESGGNGKTLFRRVMIQYIATFPNYKSFFIGKNDEYVKNLFIACGVNKNEL